MDTIDNNETPQRRIEDKAATETIAWDEPGAPAVPVARQANSCLALRHVASMVVNSGGISVFPTPAAEHLEPGHYMLSAPEQSGSSGSALQGGITNNDSVDLSTAATTSGGPADLAQLNALVAEARAVFDLMLDGCNEQAFGDFQNGHGETIGPRMDALHTKLRSACIRPEGEIERAAAPTDATCTCPSGDGSLRWPCPVHPPERAAAPVSGDLSKAEIDEIVYQCRQLGADTTYDIVNAAIARRAAAPTAYDSNEFGNLLNSLSGDAYEAAELAFAMGQRAAAPVSGDLPPLTMSVYGTRTALELERQRRADIADRAAVAAAKVPTAVPRIPTEEMLNAARDWSVKKYSQGIGNDAAIGCWQAMYDAALATPVEQAANVQPACTVPPEGWYCTREQGHDGPCAAHPADDFTESYTPEQEAIYQRGVEDGKLIARGMARLKAGAAKVQPAGELPPLPEPCDEIAQADGFNVIGTVDVFTAEQMRAYGEQCRSAAAKGQGAAPADHAKLMREAANLLGGALFEFVSTGEQAFDLSRRLYAALAAPVEVSAGAGVAADDQVRDAALEVEASTAPAASAEGEQP